MPTRKLNVLISAYACEPGAGSEGGVGWTWARAAATNHRVHVLTRANNRRHIEAALAAEPHLDLHPVYIDLPGWARRAKRAPGGVYPYYAAWQALAWRAARRLHQQERFDVAHHLTFATDWNPAGVAWVKGLPVVWGPVGGATRAAPTLFPLIGLRPAVGEVCRSLGSGAMRRIFGDATARRAQLVVAQNAEVARRFASFENVITEPNVALGLHAFPPASYRNEPDRQRKAVFAGRLVGWKGVRLAIRALAHPAASRWTLDMIGSGPEAGPCQALIERLGLADRIRLRGQLSRAETLQALQDADCMLFPSLHDSASWAVGEALSLGLPVVCLERGGPATLVSSETGIVVPASGDVIGGLAEGLRDVPARFQPVTRWDDSRLPRMLSAWYEFAATGKNPSEQSPGMAA